MVAIIIKIKVKGGGCKQPRSYSDFTVFSSCKKVCKFGWDIAKYEIENIISEHGKDLQSEKYFRCYIFKVMQKTNHTVGSQFLIVKVVLGLL
jgi:hypothetical protein